MKLFTAAFLATATTITAVGLMAFGADTPKQSQLEVVPVKVATYNATMQYLATRPYQEVYQLLAALNADGEAANAAAQAKAKPKDDKK